MEIDQTTLEDAKTTGRADVIRDAFRHAQQSLQSGDQVQIIRKYDNAPPDTIEIITSQERLSQLERHWTNQAGGSEA